MSHSSNLRILQVTPSYAPASGFGGPVRWLENLCRALADMEGVQVTVLTTDTSGRKTGDRVRIPPAAADEEKKLVVRYMRKTAGADISARMLFHLPAEVRKAGIVHLSGVYSFPTFPALLAARVSGKGLIWTPHGAFMNWGAARKRRLKRSWNFLCRLIADRSKTVLHVTSGAEAEQTARAMPGFRTALIPAGVDGASPAKRGRERGDEFRMVFLGRLHPVKAIENLLEAIALLDERARLGIYGSGEEAYVESLIRLTASLGITRRVEFHGAIGEEAKAAMFASADVLMLPSHSENFGMAAAEALAHGVPVIAGNGTPWTELDARGCGICTANNPESLATAVRKIMDADRETMGKAGAEWMRREYSWAVISRRMRELYEAMLHPDVPAAGERT